MITSSFVNIAISMRVDPGTFPTIGILDATIKERMVMANPITDDSHRWLTRAIASPLHAVVGWYRISQERSELRKLSAERLSDIGLTQREVEWESIRPFWQVNKRD